MSGLIKKDIFVMAKRFQKIQLLIMMVVIIPASQFPDMALMLIGMVLAYLAVMLVSMSFGYDVNAKWDEYVMVLPVDSGYIPVWNRDGEVCIYNHAAAVLWDDCFGDIF